MEPMRSTRRESRDVTARDSRAADTRRLVLSDRLMGQLNVRLRAGSPGTGGCRALGVDLGVLGFVVGAAAAAAAAGRPTAVPGAASSRRICPRPAAGRARRTGRRTGSAGGRCRRVAQGPSLQAMTCSASLGCASAGEQPLVRGRRTGAEQFGQVRPAARRCSPRRSRSTRSSTDRQLTGSMAQRSPGPHLGVVGAGAFGCCGRYRGSWAPSRVARPLPTR